jgi:hypothetical protein
MGMPVDFGQVSAPLSRSLAQRRIRDLCQQLKLLTPGELRLLQSEINHSLQDKNDQVLTNEELNLISSLF